MAPRKERVPIVLDTNVFVSFYLGKQRNSATARIIRLWRDQRRLQLIVSERIAQEYVEVLRRLEVDERLVQRFLERLKSRETVSWVNLGPRIEASTDPDDNVFLSTAKSGRAAFVVSQDRDLLGIPRDVRKLFRFQIVTPAQLLAELKAS